MKKILSIIAFALGFAGSAEAVIVQKIYLKNGSVLSGYIQKQEGNGNLTFHTDIAEICLKSKDATISNEKNYNIKDLGKAWIDWAEKNDEFEGVGDSRTLMLADVSSKNKSVSRVKILERGEVVKLRHGVYAEPTAMLGTMIDVERIVPGGVVCLYNAWMYYQLSTTVPPAYCIAIDAKRKVRMPETLPITLYYWKAENLTFGIVQQEISGFNVRITDLERSVCDAVKYRNKIGLDICAEIIRSYVRRKDRNLSRLMDYAKRLRLEKVLNNYLEIAIE